jgi:hypothetical protein
MLLCGGGGGNFSAERPALAARVKNKMIFGFFR